MIWAKNYRMYSYFTKEIPELINVRTEPILCSLIIILILSLVSRACSRWTPSARASPGTV